MGYAIEGRLLEVCTCDVLCPCWVGEDPDMGTCDSAIAYRIDRGQVSGVDVSNLTFAIAPHIPGNVLDGNWRVVAYVDECATPAQQDAILGVFTGKLGGPVADLAKLIGEVCGVERAPITFEVDEGRGTLRIGTSIEAQITPLMGATGQPTTLSDSVFSTIPGSPAYLGKAERFRANVPTLGFDIDVKGHNAIQGYFRFEG